jgi:tRNA/tmRNA/rRNA uracil-C5-methylase (TrmA/RlmC/RlmD family)
MISDTKERIIELKKNPRHKKVSDILYNEMRQLIDPCNQDYTKKKYLHGDLTEASLQNLFKFMLLVELGYTDVELTFYDSMEQVLEVLKTSSSLCNTNGCINNGVKHCSGCGWAKYCCRECQKNDWQSHKLMCCKKGKPTKNNA